MLTLSFDVEMVKSSHSATIYLGSTEEQGPAMDELLFRYYPSSEAIFYALLADEIDLMDYPLTYDQYQLATYNRDILTGFYEENSYISLDINNNWSIPYIPWRSPTNYTEFRQAIACLVDKDYVVWEVLQGFAMRVDTPIPRPLQDRWVAWDVSQYGPNNEWLGNYPWEYNPFRAAELLDESGFIQGQTPNPYYDPNVPWSAHYIRVYPPDHEKAFQDLDPLIVYVRTDDTILFQIGQYIVNQLRIIGIPVDEIDVNFYRLYDDVFIDRRYHLFISEWILELPLPIHLLQLYHSYFIEDAELNVIQCNDGSLDALLDSFMNSRNDEEAMQLCWLIQKEIVQKAYNVPIATRKGVFAYRKGIVNLANKKVGGIRNQWSIFNSYNIDSTVKTLRVGTIKPQDQNIFRRIYKFAKQLGRRILEGINSIYEKGFEIIKSIGSFGISAEVYKETTYTKTISKCEIIERTETSTKIKVKVGKLDNSTYMSWHDGIPLTIDDFLFELNYLTESIDWFRIYPIPEEFAKVDDYTAILSYTTSSVWIPFIIGNLEIIPKHIFETIDPNEVLHGYYPANQPPENVLIGSGPWKFSGENPGEYMLLTANRNYYRSPIRGEINLSYNWDNSYFQVDIYDLISVAVAYGSSGINEPNPNWDPSCDIAPYSSGVIDIYDLIIVASHFGKTYT